LPYAHIATGHDPGQRAARAHCLVKSPLTFEQLHWHLFTAIRLADRYEALAEERQQNEEASEIFDT